jgi:hypothetical protein
VTLRQKIERAVRGVTRAESVEVGQSVVEREESSQAAQGGVVLYPRTAIERRGGGSLLPSTVGSDVRPVSSDERARYSAERALDQILADSFPASDPPSWTLGISRPEPVRRASKVEAPADDGAASAQREPGRIDVLDVSRPRVG